MDNRTIVLLVATFIGFILIKFTLEIAAMTIGYILWFIVPLIFLNLAMLLMWTVRPDWLYSDIKLFFNDRKTMKLGPLDFIGRFVIIPGL